MKSSLHFLASFVGVAGLSLAVSLPAVAQTSPSRDGALPGSLSQPNNITPGMNRSGTTGSTYQSAVSVPANSQSESIVAIVDQSPSFELLNALIRVAALQDSGLTTELTSGEFTVFAPTDEAFAALPPDAVRALVQPENRDLLIRILSNHIVPGAVSSSEIASTNLGGNIDMGLTPPSGELRPNENVGAVRPETLAPNRNGESAGTSDGRQASAPPSGELRPNENTGNVIREELAPNANNPNQSRDRLELSQRTEQSSPGGVGSVAQTEVPGRPEATPGVDTPGNVQMGEANMNMGSSMGNMGSRDDNQASEPPSGEMRPNENVANVQGETLSPRGDRASTNMGSSSMMGNSSLSAARVIAPDIQANNGVIHAINRVILTPELQSELQEAIANLDRTSTSR